MLDVSERMAYRRPMDNPPRFDGQAAKALRTQAGLTQELLAGQAGISRAHLNNIERGHKQPSFTVAVRIADKLNVPLERVTVNT